MIEQFFLYFEYLNIDKMCLLLKKRKESIVEAVMKLNLCRLRRHTSQNSRHVKMYHNVIAICKKAVFVFFKYFNSIEKYEVEDA